MLQDAATTPTKGAIDPLPPPAQLGVGPGIVGMGQLLAAFAVMGACVAVHLVGGFALLNYAYLFVNAALMVPSAAATASRISLRLPSPASPTSLPFLSTTAKE